MNNNDKNNNYKKNNTALRGINTKTNPTKPFYNQYVLNNLEQTKKENNKKMNELLDFIKKIFFLDDNQTKVNDNYINKNTKKKVIELINNNIERMDAIKDYTKQFIEVVILPLIQQERYEKSILHVMKYNISVILECLNIKKDYFNQYYNPQLKPKTRIDRIN